MGIASRRCVGALEAAFPAGWAAMAAASSSAAATAGMEQAWAVHGQWHGYEALVAELVAALVAALMAALAAVRKAAVRMPDSRKTGRLAACKHASGYYTVEYHMLSLCVACMCCIVLVETGSMRSICQRKPGSISLQNAKMRAKIPIFSPDVPDGV